MIKLTAKEIDKLWAKYEKENPDQGGLDTWDKWLCQAQLKKVVEWIEGNSDWADKVFFGTGYETGRHIGKEEWQSLLKEAGLKEE